MKPIILFRPSYETKEEMKTASKYFDVETQRTKVANSLVVGRYSVLPFYSELEADLANHGSLLVNSHLNHQFVANMDYYFVLQNKTAKTWFELRDVPKDSGPWVLKGRTNSRKHQWKSAMFATSWEELVETYLFLSNDPLIGPQGIVVRKFLDLEVVEDGIAQPFFNEWRFFFYKGNMLSHGFYWTGASKFGEMDDHGLRFASEIAIEIADSVPFVVIDIARQKDGNWVLIELNDGQMSGLSDNSADELYSNLRGLLTLE